MTTRQTVRKFTLHNNRGQFVLDYELESWVIRNGGFEIFGPVIAYSWEVDGRAIRLEDPESRLSMHVLPDSSGFICFEDRYAEDNCLLLDAYGNERIRLTVPWELTGNEGIPPEMRQHGKPKPKGMWFIGLATAWNNPKTGEPGKLGVTAHLEYGEGPYDYHDYYFELDWQSGNFLWGRPIRI